MTVDLELVDRKLPNILQSQFPLVNQPFKNIGSELGLEEIEVMDRVCRLKERNVVRQISAIFNTRRLGYQTTLVAMRFAANWLDAGARIINEHPGVSHNYARVGPFNLWFTIAVPPNSRLEETVSDIVTRAGGETYRLLSTIRFFKIGVNFDMVKEVGDAADYRPGDRSATNRKARGEVWNKVEPITDFEIKAIKELQEDVPLVSCPFAPMEDRLNITQEQLFGLAGEFQQRGIMRRFSAVFHHRKAGFKANSMVVWNVPEEWAVDVGNTMAQSKWVTHCYQRPTFPDWPYTHFTLVHATTKEKCEEVARGTSEVAGIDDYLMLYSTREYKKTRVRYFV